MGWWSVAAGQSQWRQMDTYIGDITGRFQDYKITSVTWEVLQTGYIALVASNRPKCWWFDCVLYWSAQNQVFYLTTIFRNFILWWGILPFWDENSQRLSSPWLQSAFVVPEKWHHNCCTNNHSLLLLLLLLPNVEIRPPTLQQYHKAAATRCDKPRSRTVSAAGLDRADGLAQKTCRSSLLPMQVNAHFQSMSRYGVNSLQFW